MQLQRSFKVEERGRRERISERAVLTTCGLLLLALEFEEGTSSQRMQPTLEDRKGKGMDYPHLGALIITSTQKTHIYIQACTTS